MIAFCMHSILKPKAAALFIGGDCWEGGEEEMDSVGSGNPKAAALRGKAEEGVAHPLTGSINEDMGGTTIEHGGGKAMEGGE